MSTIPEIDRLVQTATSNVKVAAAKIATTVTVGTKQTAAQVQATLAAKRQAVTRAAVARTVAALKLLAAKK